MIQVKHVTIGYKKKRVLSNLNLEFDTTGLYAISGPSGCGKTTLLNTLGGIIEPLEGDILYSDDVKSIYRSTAFIFQENNLFDKLTVVENIKICLEIVGVSFEQEKVETILDDLRILSYKNTKVKELSGGERQRVSIAIAFLRDAKIILADEPISNLDNENARFVLQTLKKLSEDRLIIFTSHSVDLAKEYCDTFILLKELEDKELEFKDSSCGIADKKRRMMRPKSLAFVFGKVLKNNKIALIFSVALFTLLLILLSISLSLNLISEDKIHTDYIVNNQIDEIMLHDLQKNSANLKIEEYEDLQFQRVYESDIGVSNFIGYTSKVKTDYFDVYPMQKFLIDDSLGENEIRVTDYILYSLRYYGVIEFNNLNECIGKHIRVNVRAGIYEMIIKEIVITQFSMIYETNHDFHVGPGGFGSSFKYSEANGFIKMCWGNTMTIYYLVYDIGLPSISIHSEGIINYGFTTIEKYEYVYEEYKNTQLEGNEIIVTDSFCMNYKDQTGKEVYVGDVVTLSLEGFGGKKDFTFKIKDIMQNHPRSPYSYVSMESFNELSFFEYMRVAEYHYTYLVTNPINSKEIHKLFKETRDLNIEVGYEGISDVNLLVRYNMPFVGMLVDSLLIFSLVLAICIGAYTSYNMYIINYKSFHIMNLYGMKKIQEYLLVLGNTLVIVFLSAVVSIPCVYYLQQRLDRYMARMSEVEKFSTYGFQYNIYSILITLGMSIVITCVSVFITSFKKVSSHISS